MINTVDDLPILRKLKILLIMRNALQIICWVPFVASWIKMNTDAAVS